MSVFSFLTQGGFAMTGDEWKIKSTPYRSESIDFIKKLLIRVNELSSQHAIPAKNRKLLQANYLFAAIDSEKLIAIFCEYSGNDNIQYRDLREYGAIPVNDLALQLRSEVGEPVGIFSTTFDQLNDVDFMESRASEYVESITRDKPVIEGVRPHRYFASTGFSIDEKLVFVLMPFDDSMQSLFQDCIKRTIESLDFKCQRADDLDGSYSIIEDVWKKINEAKIIVAVLNHNNPNVFYELGIAHALQKATILIQQEDEKHPFDVTHMRIIKYKTDPAGYQNLQSDLKRYIQSEIEGAKEK